MEWRLDRCSIIDQVVPVGFLVVGGHAPRERGVFQSIESIISGQGSIILAAVSVRMDSDVNHGLITERRHDIIANPILERVGAGKTGSRGIGEGTVTVDDHTAVGGRDQRCRGDHEGIAVGIKIVDQQV